MFIAQGDPKKGVYDLGIVTPAVGIDTSTISRFVNSILDDKTARCSFIIYVQTEGRAGRDFNVAQAKNRGIMAIIQRCRAICCTDVDHVVPPGLLDYTVRMTTSDHLWVLHRDVTAKDVSKKAWEEYLRLKVDQCPASWNSLSSRNWFKIGGWDERCYGWGGEDDILHVRIRQAGIRTIACSDWPLCHVFHNTNREFCRENRRSAENMKFLKTKQHNYLKGITVSEETPRKSKMPLLGTRGHPIIRNSNRINSVKITNTAPLPCEIVLAASHDYSIKSTMQSLWIGPSLSKLEQLSIASFLANGHPFHLYTYDKVGNIPDGTVVLDANVILPAPRPGTVLAAFSDLFRFKLLLDKGGWWVDTDTICLKPFDFPDAPIRACYENKYVASNIIYAKKRSRLMEELYRRAMKIGVVCKWGEIGPKLLTTVLRELQLLEYVFPKEVFNPLPVGQISGLLDPEREIPGRSYALHAYNERWRRNKQDKNEEYHPLCIFEKLKNKYLSTTAKPITHLGSSI